jgi:hypothetical protein
MTRVTGFETFNETRDFMMVQVEFTLIGILPAGYFTKGNEYGTGQWNLRLRRLYNNNTYTDYFAVTIVIQSYAFLVSFRNYY